MAETKIVCVHCWIEVVKQVPMKGLIGTDEQNEPKWIHKKLTNDVGNPSCGRQFLEDDDIESVDVNPEA